MKNPFAIRSIKTTRSREQVFSEFAASFSDSSVRVRVDLEHDELRAYVRTKGRASFAGFSGVFHLRYIRRGEDSFLQFRLRPDLFDFSIFCLIVGAFSYALTMPPPKWLVAADFPPGVMIIPLLLSLIAVKLVGAYDMRRALKDALLTAAS